jgi:hypothetical protein
MQTLRHRLSILQLYDLFVQLEIIMSTSQKTNRHLVSVIKKSALHQEGVHPHHSAAITGHSSAGSHRAAHHSQTGYKSSKLKGAKKI